MKEFQFWSIQMTNFIGKQLFILQEAAHKDMSSLSLLQH